MGNDRNTCKECRRGRKHVTVTTCPECRSKAPKIPLQKYYNLVCTTWVSGDVPPTYGWMKGTNPRSFFEGKLKADGNVIDAGLANDQDFFIFCVSKMMKVYEARKYTDVHAFWENSSQWLGKQIDQWLGKQIVKRQTQNPSRTKMSHDFNNCS